MLKKISTFILITLLNINFSLGQTTGSGSISGDVFDEGVKAPIEYANIILFNSKDSSQVTGTITNKEGKFLLKDIPVGKFYLYVQFIGYEKKTIGNILISNSQKNIELGNLFIKVSAITLEHVTVQGNRSPITYQIDKKVIDVSQMATTISGNAADVLENVPSVSVDIEGNVSLRGSTNFTVLIDNRPSVMEAQDALQQIAASSIETMEIITNPSSKYDPEGNAGIINIKLKKNKNLGLSGVVNSNAGINDKYGGDFLFEYKTEKLNYHFGIYYNRRFSPGFSREEKQFENENNTSFINSNGNSTRGRISFGIRGGIDFNINNNNLFSIGGRYGSRNGNNNSILNYNQWTDIAPDNVFYLSNNERSRTGSYYAININYLRKFIQKGHELSAEFFTSHNNSDENTLSSELQKNSQFSGKRTTESGPSTEFRSKLDYTLPLDENSKFEFGSQGQIELSDESNGLYDFNTATNIYEFQPLFSHLNKYNVSELALYTIYLKEWDNLGIQGGIRTEYTYRSIGLADTKDNFSINRWDFFPSIHTSYKFDKGTQLMASYTRRIDRPHGWNLEPFLTWTDANNVRQGNPSLQPEFIDSYEFGFQTFIGKISLSNDFYYRVNNNRIENVRSVYSDNVTLTTLENIGKDFSLGSEFMMIMDPLKFWNLTFMGNLYNYKIKGVLFNESFSRESFNWSGRINNGIKISELTEVQFNVRYRSQSVSSQGRSAGFFMTDLAIKHELIEKQLSLTLQIRDLFKTGKHESTSSGLDFYTYRYFAHESPVVMLNVRFNFNNYNDKKDGLGDQSGNDFNNEGEL